MNIDSLLHRPIADGREFENLIPKVKPKYGFDGKGDTGFSIERMKAVILKFSGQSAKVATVLKKGSLEETIETVFDFCYNHFQYKADAENQMLRSLAISWAERYTGIDCKSYSIIASCILREQGIKHYIRKIIQPFDPSDFSHVYVVVPINQKTGSLANGYYVIDGTVHDNQEPEFLEKSDLFMDGLPHYSALNAPRHQYGRLGDPVGSSNGGTAPTTGSSTSGVNWSAVGSSASSAAGNYISANSSNWMKKISFKNIASLFQPCVGGTAFNQAVLATEMGTIESGINNVLNQMNAAANDNNMEVFNAKVNEYFGLTGIMVLAAVAKHASQSWNGCSRANLVEVNKAALFYFNGTMNKALEAWLDQYFVSERTGRMVYYSTAVLQARGIMPFCNYLDPAPGPFPAEYEKFTKKPGEIKGFIPTPYVFTMAAAPAAFNPSTFISGLTEAYNIVTNPGSIFTGNTGNGNGTGNGTGNNPGTVVDIPKSPQQAGMATLGYVAIGGAILFGGKLLLDQFAGNNPTKKTTR